MLPRARVLLALIQVTAGLASLSKLHSLAHYPSARCLDGSPAGFYHRPASAANESTKWVVYLEGGGECVTEASCQARRSTSLGSSKYWLSSADSRMERFVIQSLDQSINPMHGYNQLFVPYCSGDLHLGQHRSPSPWNVTFAGHHILEASLALAKASLGLGQAELVLWSGESAGGIGSLAHLDWAQEQLPGAQVLGAPVGGFYFSNDAPYNGSSPPPAEFISWTYASLQSYSTLWEAFLPTRCAAAHPREPWSCVFAARSYATLRAPLFAIEAQTDAVVMPLHDGLPALWHDPTPLCANNASGCPPAVLAYMSAWRDQMRGAISQVGLLKPRDSLFWPACLVHTGFTQWGPTVAGKRFVEALAAWVRQPPGSPTVRYVDSCSGVMCGACNGTRLQ